MEDLLQETEKGLKHHQDSSPVVGDDNAHAFGDLLREHNGQDVSVLDLRGINNWTDYFVIATTTSSTHMDGLERHIRDYCHKNNTFIFGS